MIPKSTPIRSKKLRDSARDQDCTLQIAGVCNGDPATVVLCHLPFIVGSGMATKTDDLCAAAGCSDCHRVIDDPTALPEADRLYYAARGMVRTQKLWIEMGLLNVKGAV